MTEVTVAEAIARAEASRGAAAALSSGSRAGILRALAEAVARRQSEFVEAIVAEARKPVRLARGEFERCLVTLALAAEEAARIGGEVLPTDLEPRGAGTWCIVERFPKGVVSALTPFNFPLNLVAHKVAPAIAAGCPVLLKPSPRTPTPARLLAEEIVRAGWPDDAIAFLGIANEEASPLWTDPRVAVVSFTGSDAVGWRIAREAAGKTIVLELGGNAGAVVHDDADLPDAAAKLAISAFAHAGQVCIKAQRLFVARRVYPRFLDLFLNAAGKLRDGDLREEHTILSPMIDAAAADRVAAWIDEARQAGARLLCGGNRQGDYVEPTVIEGAPDASRVWKEEVFGPVALVEPYDDFSAALSRVNSSRYGLQAAVFTRDIGLIRQAFRAIEAGGVIVNDAPSLRVDNFPYGGVKASGFGREGVRSAIFEYTAPRVLVVRG